MNRQSNRRPMTEGSSDLNFALRKNRSLPRVSSAAGQLQPIHEPSLDCERNFPAVPDGAEGPEDDDYEDPNVHVEEGWQWMKILPARPIKESEYADTRYFKGMMDTPLSLGAKIPIPAERQAWTTQMRLEEVDKPTAKDIRSQHAKGDKPSTRNKTPLPPPRLPVVIIPKKYQPLPPEPEGDVSPSPQRHPFPEVQRGPRQITLKNLNEVLGAEKAPHPLTKPESSHRTQNQSAPEIPLAVASASFMMSNHSMQSRDHKESTQSHPPQRCQAPASCGPREDALHYKNMNWRKPCPTRSDEEEAQHSEWYVGEYSRQEVEEALMKENKDGMFLVRDCSAKSCTEPYVLVVFHGNRVYNVKIRFLERNRQFALGTGLRGDEKFDSVEDIIEHYKYFPIVLIDGKDKTRAHREQCYLTRPLPLNRLSSPW
ncbi:cytokine-dependent hematopoietic cell linker [Myotis myotis]|uniref:Cytokine dependent hematopoietic cell linker n=1 Tax=Myotis myotis TaxID=51298 RepID=A0A7J8AIJ6_MYOMY|nr:cytokine-dependent hematopoietic cell linker [Myotis myotis]KAF6386343.1 cytokine dependent hematopoietic cell linker [Myotis myotis]